MEQNNWEKVVKIFLDSKYPNKEVPKFIKKDELDYYNSIYRKTTNKLKFGDHILYQVLDSNKNMSYPKLAIFLGYDFYDQALVYRVVNQIRNTENNFFRKNDDIINYNPEHEVESIIEWNDTLYIFKIWKQSPNWKEIKKIYKKTFYFRKNRKDKILKILNS